MFVDTVGSLLIFSAMLLSSYVALCTLVARMSKMVSSSDHIESSSPLLRRS